MSVFSSKKTQQGVYAAEEAKEKTQTESKQKACMGMEMEMPDSATFISGDICFFCGGCQNESSRNTQKELQGIRGESKNCCSDSIFHMEYIFHQHIKVL